MIIAVQGPRLNLDRFLFGGDYNPDQWQKYPEVLSEDIRLAKLCKATGFSLGIFGWAALEPEEGRFEFGWLDERIESLHKEEIGVILATPTGAKPNWMAEKYPEIRRVGENGLREPQGARHNHCLTSPVYRQKAQIINTQLATRYCSHPAIKLWHISNEFGGYCYCDLCMAAFQDWLKERYQTLDNLNHAWWAHFWSHTVTDWSQIKSIDESVNGMVVDWKRFMTAQTRSFIANETEPLRRITPNIPVTTNLMSFFPDYNYWEIAKEIDVVSWDAYPRWHHEVDNSIPAVATAFVHDTYRAMKPDRPWLLMECTPSVTNWQPVSTPKRPGVHRQSGFQAIAHGSDAVLHFQWRKSRGSSEQFHGAFVDHTGNEHNRVFQELIQIGNDLVTIRENLGSVEPAQAAVIFDWENKWAIEASQGPRNKDKDYNETCKEWYRPLWEHGVATHVIDQSADLSPYKLVVAPMCFMTRPGFAEKAEEFVKNGGTLVATYLTGWVDESTLAHLTGFPGPLRKLFGIWCEETDVLQDGQVQSITASADNNLGLDGGFDVMHFADVIHLEGAEAVAAYDHDYYAGVPAITVNQFGAGRAVYVGVRSPGALTDAVISSLIRQTDISLPLPKAQKGVSVQKRGDYIYVLNFGSTDAEIELDKSYLDVLTGQTHNQSFILQRNGSAILKSV